MSRFSWRRAESAAEIRFETRSPKPVVTPYTTASEPTSSSMTARLARIRSAASGASATGSPSWATRQTSSSVRSDPVRSNGSRAPSITLRIEVARACGGLAPGHAAHAARVRLVVRQQQTRPGRAIGPAQYGQARPVRVKAPPVVIEFNAQQHRQQDPIGRRMADHQRGALPATLLSPVDEPVDDRPEARGNLRAAFATADLVMGGVAVVLLVLARKESVDVLEGVALPIAV